MAAAVLLRTTARRQASGGAAATKAVSSTASFSPSRAVTAMGRGPSASRWLPRGVAKGPVAVMLSVAPSAKRRLPSGAATAWGPGVGRARSVAEPRGAKRPSICTSAAAHVSAMAAASEHESTRVGRRMVVPSGWRAAVRALCARAAGLSTAGPAAAAPGQRVRPRKSVACLMNWGLATRKTVWSSWRT